MDPKKIYGRASHRHNAPAPQPGEIWFAENLPFCDGVNSKSRPVLVQRRSGNGFICFKCTSQASECRERYELQDLEEAGLVHVSFLDYEPVYVDMNKLAYKMGHISEDDEAGFGKL